ncbi:hypothetical protein ACVWWO_007665 [Bradyrhizobium sp. F1.13.1]
MATWLARAPTIGKNGRQLCRKVSQARDLILQGCQRGQLLVSVSRFSSNAMLGLWSRVNWYARDRSSPFIGDNDRKARPVAILRELTSNGQSTFRGMGRREENATAFVGIFCSVFNMKEEPASFCGFRRLRIAVLLSPTQAIEMAASRIPQGFRDGGDQWLNILRKRASDPLVNAKDDGMTRSVREARSQDVPNAAAQHKLVVPLASPQKCLWKTR